MSDLQGVLKQVEARSKRLARAPKRPAAKTFELLPEHFAEDYAARPVAPIKIGLRIPSEADARQIEEEAAKVAARVEGESEALQAWNDAVVMLWVARGICNPLDVATGHPLFEMPEDLLPIALKPGAIRRIFDELERLHVEQSPLFPEATDSELIELAETIVADDALDNLTLSQEKRVRRYLHFALLELRRE